MLVGRLKENFSIPLFVSPVIPNILFNGSAEIEHEVNLRMIEKEMIVQRGHAQSVLQRHRHGDFFSAGLKQAR
jgi:hypothetical protein